MKSEISDPPPHPTPSLAVRVVRCVPHPPHLSVRKTSSRPSFVQPTRHTGLLLESCPSPLLLDPTGLPKKDLLRPDLVPKTSHPCPTFFFVCIRFSPQASNFQRPIEKVRPPYPHPTPFPRNRVLVRKSRTETHLLSEEVSSDKGSLGNDRRRGAPVSRVTRGPKRRYSECAET